MFVGSLTTIRIEGTLHTNELCWLKLKQSDSIGSLSNAMIEIAGTHINCERFIDMQLINEKSGLHSDGLRQPFSQWLSIAKPKDGEAKNELSVQLADRNMQQAPINIEQLNFEAYFGCH